MDKTDAQMNKYNRQLNKKTRELEAHADVLEANAEEQRNVKTEITEVVAQLREKREAAENLATINDALDTEVYELKIGEARLRVVYRILQAEFDGHLQTSIRIIEWVNTMERAFWDNDGDFDVMVDEDDDDMNYDADENDAADESDDVCDDGNDNGENDDADDDVNVRGDDYGGNDDADARGDDIGENDDADDDANVRGDDYGGNDDADARGDDIGENDDADDEENVEEIEKSLSRRSRSEKLGRSASKAEKSHDQSNDRSRSPQRS